MLLGNLPPLTKNRTCAFTGHRILKEDFSFSALKEDILKIYNLGYDIFLCGMAKGFDLACFEAVLSLKEEYSDVKICAVIPCSDQAKYFSVEDKIKYNSFLEQADFTVLEEKTYYKNCMLKRNEFLVNNSSLLYAYFNGEKKGGTYYTISLAKKNQMEIVYYGK